MDGQTHILLHKFKEQAFTVHDKVRYSYTYVDKKSVIYRGRSVKMLLAFVNKVILD
jgi:hypothetical protein